MSSILKKSLPITIPSFVNRVGTIGLSLVPMLLVERALSLHHSTMVMSSIKIAVFIGTFVGAWLTDFVGLKRSLIASFFFSGLGMACLPLSDNLILLTLFGIMAQLGASMFQGPARLLITRLLPISEQQEGIGWLRTSNNLGMIFSFSIGYLAGGHGITPLMFFDATTSFLAMFFAIMLLPSTKPEPLTFENQEKNPAPKSHKKDWTSFYVTAVIVAFFSFFYEAYMTAASARCQALFGKEGVSFFSKTMLVNTVLCALLAVFTTRKIHSPKKAFPFGIILVFAGAMLVVFFPGERSTFYASALLATTGEIVFLALSSFTIIRVTPRMRGEGSVYGLALLLQNSGRFLGGALAFPLLYQKTYAIAFFGMTAAASMILCFLFGSRIEKRAESYSKTL